MSKNNVPYYIAGTLAAFTLLASGVFAAAPYIGFLAPVAALSVGLPFIIGGAVFSAVAIALSYAAISKNKTISEKEAQLADEKSKVEAKGKIISEKEAVVQDQKQTISELEAKIQAQEQTISGQNDQLTKKEAEVKAKEEEISKQKKEEKDIKTACEKEVTTVKEACSSGRIFDIAQRSLKDVYDIIPSTESVRNWVPSLRTAGWIGVVGAGATIAAYRGFTGANNSSNAVSNSVNSVRNHTLSSNSSFTCPNPTMQHPYELRCALDEYSKIQADSEEFAKNNFGISEENEPQWSKDLHKSETTEEIMDGDTLSNLFYEGNNSDYQFATSNVTEPARISETIGSNQTAVVRHSGVDTSGTCPANSYTSLEKYNIGTCPSQDVCPNETSSLWSYMRSLISFGSREHRVNTVDSSVKDSGYQFPTPNVTAAPARISETVGPNQATILDNVTVSTKSEAQLDDVKIETVEKPSTILGHQESLLVSNRFYITALRGSARLLG